MAEYYAVLSKAVAGLTESAESRRKVYDKARNALIGQLKAVDPPLPTQEISRQRLELEEAIRRVEREAASAAMHAAPKIPRHPPPPPQLTQQPQQRPPSERMPEQAPPDAYGAPEQEPPPAAYDHGAGYEQGGAYEQAPAPARSLPTPRQNAGEVFRRAVEEAGQRPPPPAAPQQDPYAAQRPPPAYEPAHQPPPAGPTQGYDAPGYGAAPEPQLRGSYQQTGEDPFGGAPEPGGYVQREPESYMPPRDPGREARRERGRGYSEPRVGAASEPGSGYDWGDSRGGAGGPSPLPDPFDDHDDFEDEAPRRGRRGRGRREREREDAFDDRELAEQPARRSRLPAILFTLLILAVLVGLGAVGWSQRDVLLDLVASFDQGGAQPTLSEPQDGGLSEPVKAGDRLLDDDANVRLVGPQPDDAPLAPPTTPDGGDLNALVAQRATLYEEPLNQQAADAGVVAIDADVTWSFVGNGVSGPEAVAELHVPDRNLTIRMSIRKNDDQTLPASHLVEIVATGAVMGISQVPRLVMKATEDGRGQPLVGAAANVAEGFFWIALSAKPDDVTLNMGLLRERPWVDLPLVYESGQRAILTFEKGTPGQRVLDQAMAAWGN